MKCFWDGFLFFLLYTRQPQTWRRVPAEVFLPRDFQPPKRRQRKREEKYLLTCKNEVGRTSKTHFSKKTPFQTIWEDIVQDPKNWSGIKIFLSFTFPELLKTRVYWWEAMKKGSSTFLCSSLHCRSGDLRWWDTFFPSRTLGNIKGVETILLGLSLQLSSSLNMLISNFFPWKLFLN